INDLLPHYSRLKNGDEWIPYGDRLLEHTLKKVNRFSEKNALRTNCVVLGNPGTAPDAMFALGYQLDKHGLEDAFQSLQRIGMPDVCLVNVTRGLRLPAPSMFALLRQFFRAWLEEFSKERPGLIIVADDPGVSFRIRELAAKELDRVSKQDPKM